MFEFILAFSRNGKVKLPDFLYYDNSFHLEKEIKYGSFYLKYQSFINDKVEDFYEDDTQILVLYGSIFSSVNTDLPSQITASYLAQHANILNEPEEYLRGNYAVIKYNKIYDEVDVIIDPLGLKPIYIFEKDNIIYLSSSLWILARLTNTLNEEGILEILIFGYNITEKTSIQNIHTIENGTKLKLKNGKVNKQKYFNIEQLVTLNPRNYDLEELRSLFNNIVNKRINEQNNDKEILVTLTGGNDGRAVLSSVYYWNRKFKTFSFGMRNGENTYIPECIAQKLGFSHYSIYLENSFLEEYFNNALNTIIFSDGNLSFEQQSTFYAFKKIMPLLNNSLLLTGLIAGEILGPIHLKNDYFNEHYFNLILNYSQLDENYLSKHEIFKFINKEFFNKHKEYLLYTINKRKKQLNESIKQTGISHLAYYFDLINLGFRKFYGMQMHLIRYYAENLPVFYDFDIIKFILSTNYHFIFKNSFKSLRNRWQSRIPQSYITFKNYPPLGKLKLDRGFSPEDLLHPIKKYFTFLPYLKRKYVTKPLHPDFDSPNWCLNFLSKIKFENYADIYFNVLRLREYIKNLQVQKNIYDSEINKMISIYSFLKELNK